MSRGVFVTGATGFAGRVLLPRLVRAGFRVTALVRGPLPPDWPEGVAVVPADLTEAPSYSGALRGCDVVIHLAAATGKAPASEHQRVNVQGTAALIDAARRAGVSRFLHVSTIAVTFPDQTAYHYARAKARAEVLVEQSGLRYAIIRPTMIGGAGAPVLEALQKLARLPVIVLPGTGRVRVQPIDVGAVADGIVTLLAEERFQDQVEEWGGDEILTMDALLQRLRSAAGLKAGRVLRVPIALLRLPLRLAEAVGVGRLLPLTAGQLASFVCDGVASEQPDRVEALEAGALTAECRVFTQYLLGAEPDDYVAAQYGRACRTLPALVPSAAFDAILLTFARRGRRRAAVADAYAAAWRRSSALRQRLVVLIALLETRAPFSAMIDAPMGGSVPGVAGRGSLTVAGALVHLVIGTLIFAPVHLLAGRRR